MIHDASGSADNYICAFEPCYLSVHRSAAIDFNSSYSVRILGKTLYLVTALQSKLSCRTHYYDLYGLSIFFCVYLLDSRYSESHSFSRTGLRTADYIRAVSDKRYSLSLDFGRLLKTHIIQSSFKLLA